MTAISIVDANLILRRMVGKRIRAARKARGLTQPILAKLSQLHISHLSKIERGQANATLSSLLAIAMALEIDLFEVFRETRLSDFCTMTNKL